MSTPPTKGKGAPSGSEELPQDAQDLSAFVSTLLEQMQTRFTQMSESIVTKVDQMGARLDDLEKSIADLMVATGVEGVEGEALDAQQQDALEAATK